MAILLCGSGISTAQTGGDKKTTKKEKRAAEFEITSALIEGGNFIFRIQSVSPSGGKTRSVTSPYSMKAANGVYEAYLPYIGRSYQADLGGNGGIEFYGEPSDLKITKKPEKFSLTLTFNIAHSSERYDVTLQVGSNGYGTLIITSQRRQTISYYGMAAEPAEE